MPYLTSLLRNALRRVRRKHGLYPHALVPASDVRYILRQNAFPTRPHPIDAPHFIPGDWDQQKRNFHNTPLFGGFRDHFIHNKPWPDTEYYRLVERGYRKTRVSQYGGVDQFFANYDKLFHVMREGAFEGLPPLEIAMGRNGELIRFDGAHRLAIAKLLSIEKVPIRLLVIHPKARPYAEAMGIDLTEKTPFGRSLP